MADIYIAVACKAIACSTANLASCSFGSFVGGICIRVDKVDLRVMLSKHSVNKTLTVLAADLYTVECTHYK